MGVTYVPRLPAMSSLISVHRRSITHRCVGTSAGHMPGFIASETTARKLLLSTWARTALGSAGSWFTSRDTSAPCSCGLVTPGSTSRRSRLPCTHRWCVRHSAHVAASPLCRIVRTTTWLARTLRTRRLSVGTAVAPARCCRSRWVYTLSCSGCSSLNRGIVE